MKLTFYLSLQFLVLRRKVQSIGFSPIVAYVGITLIAVICSILILDKFHFAGWIYACLSLFLIGKLSSKARNSFLKLQFPSSSYYVLRVVENMLAAIFPLVMLGLFYQVFPAVFLLIGMIGLAFIRFDSGISLNFPTPFFKHPYEFIVGFRQYIWLILASYFLAYQGVRVENFTLIVIAYFFLILSIPNFLSEIEKPFHVWIYDKNPRAFLLYKLWIGLIYSSFLSLPLGLVTTLSFTDQLLTLFCLQMIIYLNLASVILVKYARFPQKADVFFSIMVGLGMAFPPFLLFIYFYFGPKAFKNLSQLLT
ncbi:MAG: hypothetical protein AAGC85_06125 [Bacteroidota bacterium]